MISRIFFLAVVLSFTSLSFSPTVGFTAEGAFQRVADTEKDKELKEVKAKIVKINAAAKSIRIEPGILSSEKDLMVTDKTKIVVNGKPGDFTQLREGDKVKIHYSETPTKERTAVYIEVLG